MLTSRAAVRAGVHHVLRLGRPTGANARPAGGGSTTRCASTAAGPEQPVAPIDIPALAKMAHINVTEQEVADWEPKISGIVDWFGQLQAVGVEGVPPAVHARDEGNVLREDAPAVYPERPAIMQQVPEQQGGLVRVPRIATGADAAASAASSAAGGAGSSSGSSSAAASSSDAVSSSEDEATTTSSSGGGAAADLASPVTEQELAQLAALDIRVGRILSCEPHPDADSLYVEKIDVGEPEPRTIVSGLVKYVPLEAMQGRGVVVLANLKPRNMRGIKSAGMLLAASNEEHTEVEPLAPPPGAAPGSRVWFGEHRDQPKPMEPNPLAKKKVWEGVQPLLRTDGGRAANFKGAVMQTAEGPVTAESLTGARIG